MSGPADGLSAAATGRSTRLHASPTAGERARRGDWMDGVHQACRAWPVAGGRCHPFSHSAAQSRTVDWQILRLGCWPSYLPSGLLSCSVFVLSLLFVCSTFKDLGLDSLDEVEVVMMLEDEFVIDIQDEVASSIVSVQDAVNYITQHPFAANDEAHH